MSTITRLIIACAATLAAAGPVAAQECRLWVDRQDAHQSSWLYPVMTFDSARNVSVMYSPGLSYESVTYEWDGDKWFQRAAGFPASVALPSIVFVEANAVSLMHGGFRLINGIAISETWTWNGTQWTHITSRGPARYGHTMVYDSSRNVVVLFGGFDATNSWSGETWEWDGSSWTLVSDSGPDARYMHAMAFDSNRNVAVIFGGRDQASVLRRDTWEWDGANWSIASQTGPSPRSDHKMVFDSERGVTVLFGGVDGALKDDTWEWDGNAWTQVGVAGPSGRATHAMAFDSNRNVTVLFGGVTPAGWSSETWEFGSFASASITQNPKDQIIDSGYDALFFVQASGSNPMDYQWRKDGSPLSDNGRISGTNTDTLIIQGVASADAGLYDVLITNPCGTIESSAAALTVSCPADFNNDGLIDTLDVLFFLNAFTQGDPIADFNGDGQVNSLDFLAFLNAWIAGCP